MSAPSCDGTEVYKHHEQGKVCFTRAKYREGRRPRAVKVYTVNLESRYLLIQGVPAVGVMKELVELFALYGAIEEYRALDEYPAEPFTEVYLLRFQKLQSARVAKKKQDERSFFGSLLHVCYAPEFETVQETREKLQERRRYIARATSNRGKVWCKREQQHEDRQVVPKTEHETPPETSVHNATESVNMQDWSSCTYYGFPLLPPPPQPDVRNLNTPSSKEREGQSQMAASFPLVPGNGYESARAIFQGTSPKQVAHMENYNAKLCPPWSQKRTPPATNDAAARFLPRPTQLQERRRRREEDAESFFRTNNDTNEVIIGPKLPEIPKVDMGDDSLNQSVNLIRHTLTKVSSAPLPEEKKAEHLQAKPPLKQRRRI